MSIIHPNLSIATIAYRPQHSDVLFEVVSASTYAYDRMTKADAYLTIDVRELCLVDPVSMTIEVRHRDQVEGTPLWKIAKYSTGEYAKSRVLAGWEVSVDEIFKDLA